MLESKIFERYSPDFEKLEQYGFSKSENGIVIEKLFKDDLFKAVVWVNLDGKVSGTVIELENDDEFLPLRVEDNQGTFVGEIRACYEQILCEIRDVCFVKKYFIYPQANRIAALVYKKYQNTPEFLWEKFSGSGIFRNSKSGKWYLGILDVERSKIQPKAKKGIVEVADIKLPADKIQELLKLKDFYPGYHMNKKSWITVILDDSLTDDAIMELVEESYRLTDKKSR